jgi:hypothetical protein
VKAALGRGKVIVSSVILEEQRQELLRLARDADRTLSAEIRMALARHVAQPTPTTDEEQSPS